LIERSELIGKLYDVTRGGPSYDVRTDEAYRVQDGDKTIQVIGDADVIFDDVCIEGFSFWLSRGNNLHGYVYVQGSWQDIADREVG
jgi:hypothetical protein